MFIAEISEMPLSLQPKLLQVLQDKQFSRLGAQTDITVDVRFISATNRPLENLLREGKFRQDLYYRINVITIQMPPLRERKSDIPELAGHFLRKHAVLSKKGRPEISENVLRLFMQYDWPGNVRELDHTVERAVLLSQEDAVRASHLGLRPASASGASPRLEELSLEEVERVLIQKALARFSGNVSQAATALGLSRSGLYRRLQKYGL